MPRKNVLLDPVKRYYGGNKATYLLARLDQEHPELAARVRAGELKAKTAARQAGIVKTKTALHELMSWWHKATPDERATFRDWMQKRVMSE